MFDTYFKHHKLYQYVFTKERDNNITMYDLTVETPVHPEPFKDSKQVHVWEYEQKIGEIEESEAKRKTEKTSEKEGYESERLESFRKSYESVENLDKSADREVS